MLVRGILGIGLCITSTTPPRNVLNSAFGKGGSLLLPSSVECTDICAGPDPGCCCSHAYDCTCVCRAMPLSFVACGVIRFHDHVVLHTTHLICLDGHNLVHSLRIDRS